MKKIKYKDLPLATRMNIAYAYGIVNYDGYAEDLFKKINRLWALYLFGK